MTLEPTLAAPYTNNRKDWRTPPELLTAISGAFFEGQPFELDAAATSENKLAPDFLADAFAQPWPEDCLIWCNPPYGRQKDGRATGDWLAACKDASDRGSDVVCLLPSRTDTRWFHDYAGCANIALLKGRLKFAHPDEPNAVGAPFPSCLFLFPGDGQIMPWDWRL